MYANEPSRSEPECAKCLVLREWLEQERERSRYFEQLLLTRAGIIHTTEDKPLEQQEDWAPIRKITTMSQLRNAARNASRSMNNLNSVTDEERAFEEELNRARAAQGN